MREPRNENEPEVSPLLVIVGVGVVVAVLWPELVTATLGGALTGAGGYLLKKAFGSGM